MKHVKRNLIFIALTVCGILLCKPAYASAETKTVGNLVLMVDFEGDTDYFDKNYKNCEAIYTKDSPNSVHAYISAISDGQVKVNSIFPQDYNDSFVHITLSKSSASYTETEFITEAVNKANALLSEGKLASVTGLDSGNFEGCIDNVTFIVKVAAGGDTKSNPYYAHKADGAGQWTLFGKKVAAYNVIPSTSLWITDDAVYNWGYTTISHELLHSLGAPDLYRTTGDIGEPVGVWDHMASVYSPANYPLVYTRKDLGWIPVSDTPTVTESGDYTLVPAESTSGTRAYILKTELSSSEFFVVEYRVKTEAATDGTRSYEYYLPESGLIVYRVNTAVTDHTNAAGDNYIYVFRPGTLDNKNAYETYTNSSNQTVNSVNKAAVGTTSRPTLGSANMDDPCTKDTIFYDDGSNSGLVISNVRFENGTATFHVEFPKLSEDSYWLEQGEAVTGLQYPAISGSEDGSVLYLAGKYNNRASLFCSENGGDWKNIESVSASNSVSNIYDVLYSNGQVYMLYINANSTLSVGKYADNRWSTVYTYDTGYYPNNASFVSANGNVWISSYTSEELLVVNVDKKEKLPAVKAATGSSIANPTAFCVDGKWYAVYSDYLASGDAAKGKVVRYDEQSSAWTEVYTINGIAKVHQAEAYVSESSAYVVAKCEANKNAFLTFDGSAWTEQALNDIDMSTGFEVTVKDGVPYIIWSQGTVLKARYLKNGTWTELANTICSDANDFDSFCGGTNLYVASSTVAGSTTVRKMKTVEGTKETEPEIGSGNLVLELPDGYDSTSRLYIDGIEVSGAAWQGDESKRLVSIGSIESLGTTAKIAEAVRYNSSGIPSGMYVWRLSYNGSYYTATAIPEFEDLFLYHGFSGRYKGKTGIRCTYSIDVTKKSQLISDSGLAGYRMTEIGTLIMSPGTHENYPMIYGSDKLSSGRCYYKKAGKTYNKVIRTVDGRDYFANVLINLPTKNYDTAFFFKSYALMEYDGSTVVIYGPEMSRSMYKLCKQVLARGDFKEGTSGYEFLKNIVDTVESEDK